MKICVTNKLGRPYLISYVVKEDKENYTKYLLLNRGINIVDGDLFEKVKTHPLVRYYLDAKIFVITDAIENSKNNKAERNIKAESTAHKDKHGESKVK